MARIIRGLYYYEGKDVGTKKEFICNAVEKTEAVNEPKSLRFWETKIQCDVVALARELAFKYKELSPLRELYMIPNGARLAGGGLQGGILLRMGLTPGIPDLHLPVARGKFHSAYVELKSPFGGEVSTVQRKKHKALREEGNCVEIFDNEQECITFLVKYLTQNFNGVKIRFE